MIIRTTTDVLTKVYRDYMSAARTQLLEADGEPPADAMLPGIDGTIWHRPSDDAAVNDQYRKDLDLASRANLQLKNLPRLLPTRYRRYLESIRARDARFLREATAEVEAYLA